MEKLISQQNYRKIITIATFVSDFLTLAAGFFISISFVDDGLLKPDNFHIRDFIAGLPILEGQQYLTVLIFVAVFATLTIFGLNGLYKKEISYLNYEEIRKIVNSLLVSSLLSSLAVALEGKPGLSVNFLLPAYSIILPAIIIERYIFYWIAKKNYKKGRWVNQVIIYDACPTGRMLLKKLYEAPQFGYKPIGFIDNRRKKDSLVETNSLETNVLVPVLGNLNQINSILKNHPVAELFIATPAIRKGDLAKIINAAKRNNLPYRFVPNLIEEPFLHRARMISFGGIPFIRTEEPRLNLIAGFIKRIFDIVFSLVGLIILAPVFIAVSALLKYNSRGTVLFKQERVGRYGKSFTMYKFRTMKVNVKKYSYSPQNAQDARITKIGAFLRRTSLDEIPQLFNVLRGEMSLVGPRPEMKFIVKKYNNLQKERLLVKPGITGIWQVTADRKKQIHENIDYDIYYINNMSFTLDILVIIRTFWSVVKGVGAV